MGRRRCFGIADWMEVIFVRVPNAERRTPNAERRTPNAERRTPNAERRTPNAGRYCKFPEPSPPAPSPFYTEKKGEGLRICLLTPNSYLLVDPLLNYKYPIAGVVRRPRIV